MNHTNEVLCYEKNLIRQHLESLERLTSKFHPVCSIFGATFEVETQMVNIKYRAEEGASPPTALFPLVNGTDLLWSGGGGFAPYYTFPFGQRA